MSRVTHHFHLHVHLVPHVLIRICLLLHTLLLHTLVVSVAVHVGVADTLPVLTPVALVAAFTLLVCVAELASQQTSLFGTEVACRTVLVCGGTAALAFHALIAILAPQAV